MRLFVADEQGLKVLELIGVGTVDPETGKITQETVITPEIREEIRTSAKEGMYATHVWFEDEIGTALDPVGGPLAVYGAKAQSAGNN
jgi:hypothetical protein